MVEQITNIVACCIKHRNYAREIVNSDFLFLIAYKLVLSATLHLFAHVIPKYTHCLDNCLNANPIKLVVSHRSLRNFAIYTAYFMAKCFHPHNNSGHTFTGFPLKHYIV